MNRRKMLGGTSATLLAGFTAWPGQAQAQDRPNLLGYRRTNWSRDPFSFGSYSYVARGSRRSDHRRMSTPIAGKLYFAGEAANPERNSSVHAALESGRWIAEAVLNQGHQRIGIIGAGISGLSAAHILDSAGREVQVIEGRDRIGGRLHTDTSRGFTADLGASWLHGSDGNPLTEVTDQLGMRKVVFDNSSYVVRDRGRVVPDSDLPDWIEEVSAYDNRAGASRRSMNEWAYVFVDDYGGDEILFPDGYSQILDAFQGGYDVRLNDAVTALEYADQGVRVTSQSGQEAFDAVMVTVPLGVLKAGAIAFTPALPEETQRAIDRLGFGTLDKMYLQFDRVFWDEDAHNILTPFTDFEPGFYNNWVNLHAAFDKPVLLGFNGGPAALALSSEPDDTVVGNFERTILQAYGFET